MTPEDRKRVPEMHQMWIDIGAKDRDDALERGSEMPRYTTMASNSFTDPWRYRGHLMTRAVHTPSMRLSFVWPRGANQVAKWWRYPPPRRRSAPGGRSHRLISRIQTLLWRWTSVMPRIIRMRITANMADSDLAEAPSLPVGRTFIRRSLTGWSIVRRKQTFPFK